MCLLSAEILGCSKKDSDRAVENAYRSQLVFWNLLKEQGRQAVKTLSDKGREGIVLLGRPYNICDSGINMNIGKKLRDHYGIDVIPMDFLPIDGIKIHDITENMFWSYGKKILAASRFISRHPNLHIIYITNFKCGPDSYIKHYVTDASKKPYLTLQFDAHSNDAGMITRCEAYLDSKGVLRNWKQKKSLVA
jgi:predicted nucleotide-binding protein (sugar kinase/HSP70/actin superfamily)